MAALTKARNTPTMGDAGKKYSYPVAASTTIYQGSMACLDASGNCIPGAANTTSGSAMLCLSTADNSAGLAAAIKVELSEAVAQFVNGNSITKAAIGALCYYADDQTVTSSGAGSSVAGIIVDVDSNGVWVRLAQPAVEAY